MHKAMAAVASAAVLSTVAFGANAADLIISPNELSTSEISYTPSDLFTGFYVGGTGGIVTADDFDDEDSNAWSLGGQFGYTQQFGAFVIGAEAEALWLDELAYSLDAASGVTQDWAVTAKARAGVALDHTLLYGTLGYSITEFEGYGGAVVEDDLVGGLQWGLGIEQAFTDTISARLEYTQTYYDDVAGADLEAQAVKVGLNFRF